MLWTLGYPDQALRAMEEALALAEELAHPFGLVFTLWHTAPLHQQRGDTRLAEERVAALIGLATEQGSPQFLARGLTLRGWLLVDRGEHEAGMAELHRGMAAYRAAGRGRERSHFLALLADACCRVGQIEQGLEVVAEALESARVSGERLYETELHRTQGELLLSQAVPAEADAERCFSEAIAVARRQEAKSLELRAVTSLARLWQRQGRVEPARQALAEIYGWFTEGFATRDLREARALLDELS
jgi:adenylate cyclase